MFTQFFKVLAFAALAAVCLPAVAVAQTPPGGQTPPLVNQGPPSRASAAAPAGTQGQPRSSTTPCGNTFEEPEPAKLPSANIGPVTFIFELCFNKQGGSPTVDAETYTYYITFDEETEKSNPPSNNSTGRQWDGWRPYNEASEQMIRDDFRRVWDQGLLDDLSIEATDYTFSNGAIGKIITYNMEERDRVKIVTYEGSKQVDRTKIEEQLRDRSLVIAADSLLDERKIRLVEGVVREMMVEKGFNPEVSHTVEPIKNSPKTVNITFHISEGPKVKVRRVDFIGNKAFSDGKLQRQLKENKPVGMLSFITGTGTYNAAKFEEDADKVSDFYMNRGYAGVRVGQPELKELETTKSGKTKWVEIRIPISEGNRYTFGALDFEGNSRVRSEFLRTLYKVEPGEIYSRKRIIDGNNKAREVYGEVGFMEFTPFPELKASDDPTQPEATLAALVPEGLTVPASPSPGQTKPAHMDITIRVTEGEQFFVNRIVFTGNTTTRDNVIRRELGRLVESAPFDSQALKTSIRRLNQLGYFKPLEGNDKDMKVEKTAGQTNMVDVTLKLEEQNRNQLTFGAGISQYEGFFGQLAFQTSNFMGRGESLTVSLQGGERAQNYQLGFTEPFLFDRNITGGVDVHKRSLQYLGYYTQKSTGGNIVFGVPVAIFSRMFFNYSYEAISITDLNEALIDNSCLLTGSCSTISNLSDLSQQLTSAQLQQVQRNPFVADSLLLAQGGKRTISKVVPTFLHNTVDHPIFPTQGRKYTASIDVAVLGGNTQFYKPHLEGIWFFKHTSRTSLGLRGVFEYIAPLRNTTSLPVFERLFLGGEYSVRGFDIRSIGPTVEGSPVVLGGNKSLNFNAEYSFTIAQPVRLLLFYDAGQVRDFGKSFAWNEDRTQLVFPTPPPLVGVFGDIVQPLDAPTSRTEVIGKTSAFKTSTGIELRFFMPVLNVPFRLIYAWNPQRVGVLDNSLQPAKNATFKFSVGTTF